MKYIPTIGLEIHAELKTRSKMFCACPNDPLEQHPNVNVCPICMGHPGTLPVINEEAVKEVIKVGLALQATISEYSKFDRKNYFYPDLPKGYQISQYDAPLCRGGFLDIPCGDSFKSQISNLKITSQTSKLKRIPIRRIHLEEDTGRLIHPEGADYSLVDFNRAGIPLMELVTEPDISSAKEARKFAEELQLILRYLEVSDADMEKGEMRVEANVSLLRGTSETRNSESETPSSRAKLATGQANPKSETKNPTLGTKVEIKNLNSFRSVERAVEYEINRQKKILDSGKEVIQETRGWDDAKQITFSQRTKEEAHDYRYFPEPDLPPLHLSKEYIAKIKAEIPELPQGRRERFVLEYKLSPQEIEIFVVQKDLGEYYEKVMSELRAWIKEQEIKSRVPEEEFLKLAKLAANYTRSDLQGLLKGASVAGEDFLITPEDFAELITLLYEDKISSKIAKQVLSEMFSTGADPHHIIKEKKLTPIGGKAELEEVVKEVISQNQKAIEDYKKGKTSALQFLVGQVMAKTRGRAEPDAASRMLLKHLTK